MKITSRFCIVALIAAGFGIGCSDKDPSSPLAPGNASIVSVDDPCGEITSVRLLAGQHIDVGTVTVENDGVELCVRYETSGDWTLVETHLDIRVTPGDIPQTKQGNPKVGKFAYKHERLGGVTVDEYCFLLDDLGYTAGTDLFIAAHAVVERVVDGSPVQGETAWGEGPQFPGNNWAMYLGHQVQECNQEGPFDPGEFTTFPQSEWGEECTTGSQASCYLLEHWESCFGSGEDGGELVVGCPIQGKFLAFTDPFALLEYLPVFNEGTLSQPLVQNYFNPIVTGEGDSESHQGGEGGELLGQVIALTLSLTFDGCDADFGTSDLLLGDLVVCTTSSPFSGMTVQQVLDEANRFLGGCGSTFTSDELTTVLTAINESFVPGQASGDFLCPAGTGGEE